MICCTAHVQCSIDGKALDVDDPHTVKWPTQGVLKVGRSETAEAASALPAPMFTDCVYAPLCSRTAKFPLAVSVGLKTC